MGNRKRIEKKTTMHLSQTRTGWASASVVRGVLPWVHLSQKISPQFRQWCWKYNRFDTLKDIQVTSSADQYLTILYPAVESTEICCTCRALGDSFIWDLKESLVRTCNGISKGESMNKTRIKKKELYKEMGKHIYMWHNRYETISRMQTIVCKTCSTMTLSNRNSIKPTGKQ